MDVKFSCDCGRLKGVLHDATPKNCCHLICYCKACRAFARHLGQADALKAGGGSPLVQVAPSRIEITDGAEHIACLRLSPKGLHRWYAACCDTPLANTLGTPKLPLAGMWLPNFETPEAFGPVTTHAHVKMALSGGPRKDTGTGKMIGGLLKRTVAGYLSATARESPFFNTEGTPIVAPTVLSREARAAAYAEAAK